MESDLLCKAKRRFDRTTDTEYGLSVYPNRIRGFRPTYIDQIWVADITYVRRLKGFAFAEAILGPFSRGIVVWAIFFHLTSELTSAALRPAFEARRPPQGLIDHSDRGVQYASREHVAPAERCGMQISILRRGNPYENPIVKKFFKTLKTKEVYLVDVGSFDELRQRLTEYIDDMSNTKQLH